MSNRRVAVESFLQRTIQPGGVVAALGLAALATRFLFIGKESVWIDEAISWRFAHASLQHMFDLTAQDKHPPFYYGVLHFWVRFFGDSEIALRVPSAIAGSATILLLAAIGWRVGGWLVALTAGLLLILNPAHLAASQDARMYALVSLLALAASAVLAGYVSEPSVPRFLAYVALMTLVIYTHYSGLFVLGVHCLLFGAFGLRELVTKRRPWILLAGLGTVTVLGLAYVPWFSTFRAQLASGTPYYIPKLTVSGVSDVSRSLLGLDRAGRLWVVFAVPLLSLGAMGVLRRRREPLVVCVGAIALVPVTQLLYSIPKDPVFNLRQAAPYTPGLAFLMALGLFEITSFVQRRPRVRGLGHTALAVFGISILILMGGQMERRYARESRQDWRSVAADLAGTSKPIYIAPGFQWDSFAYYAGVGPKVTPLWQKDLQDIAAGAAPVSSDKTKVQSILIAQDEAGQAVVPAFKKYFDVSGLQQYSGAITTYRLLPLSVSEQQ